MEVFSEYGAYFKHLWSMLMSIDKAYIIMFSIIFLLIHIGLSVAAYKLLRRMKEDINPVIWFPFINVYYIATKGVHSLMAVIIGFETFLLLPLPFVIGDVITIHSLVQSYAKILLVFLIITEYFISVVALVIKYIIYDAKIKIVR